MDSEELARRYAWIVGELAQWRPVAESMSRLIDECESTCPHPNWQRLRALPYADVSPLVSWLEPLFRKQPPTKPLKGLWFGLFNPIYAGEAVADMYVAGYKLFNSKNHLWATLKNRVWWPDGRYAGSVILADIYRIAHTPVAAPPPPWATVRAEPGGPDPEWDLENYAEYPLVLGYTAFAVREVLGRLKPALVLGALVEKKGYVSFAESKSIGVTVGFDSGDSLCLAEFGPTGFTKPAEPVATADRPRE